MLLCSLTSRPTRCATSCLRTRPSTASSVWCRTAAAMLHPARWTTLHSRRRCTARATSESLTLRGNESPTLKLGSRAANSSTTVLCLSAYWRHPNSSVTAAHQTAASPFILVIIIRRFVTREVIGLWNRKVVLSRLVGPTLYDRQCFDITENVSLCDQKTYYFVSEVCLFLSCRDISKRIPLTSRTWIKHYQDMSLVSDISLLLLLDLRIYWLGLDVCSC